MLLVDELSELLEQPASDITISAANAIARYFFIVVYLFHYVCSKAVFLPFCTYNDRGKQNVGQFSKNF